MSFDVYETEEHGLKHILFKRKHAWQPVGIKHRVTAAAKHLIKKKN